MNGPECSAFRRALGSALAPAGGTARDRDVGPGWHEHLLACPACRALLDDERALDGLLATLPRPRLPGDLARRVLARLEGARSQERSGRRLDDLLDLLPSPTAPDDLAARTLRRLASERRGWPRLVRGGWRIAAALLIALGALWLALAGRPGLDEVQPEPAPRGVAEVEDELLESLDVLENWDLLMSDDLDLVLAELDAVDWALLEYGSEEAEVEDGAEPQRGG